MRAATSPVVRTIESRNILWKYLPFWFVIEGEVVEMSVAHEALVYFNRLALAGRENTEKTIEVLDSRGNLILTNVVEVSVSENESTYNSTLHVYWEEYGVPEYKEKGLFGSFSSQHAEIKLESGKLETKDSNGNTYIIYA